MPVYARLGEIVWCLGHVSFDDAAAVGCGDGTRRSRRSSHHPEPHVTARNRRAGICCGRRNRRRQVPLVRDPAQRRAALLGLRRRWRTRLREHGHDRRQRRPHPRDPSTSGADGRSSRSPPAMCIRARCSTTPASAASASGPTDALDTGTPQRSATTRRPRRRRRSTWAPAARRRPSPPGADTRVRCSTTAACAAGLWLRRPARIRQHDEHRRRRASGIRSAGIDRRRAHRRGDHRRRRSYLRAARRRHRPLLGPRHRRAAGPRQRAVDRRQRVAGQRAAGESRRRPHGRGDCRRTRPHLRDARRWQRALLGARPQRRARAVRSADGR